MKKIKVLWKKRKPLSTAQERRFKEAIKYLNKWKKLLRLHPDTEIHVSYVGKKNYSMEVDFKHAEYSRFYIHVAERCLKPKRDKKREASCIHELLHILVYPYTFIAFSLVDEDIREMLNKKEEEMITSLEIVIAKLMGIGV